MLVGDGSYLMMAQEIVTAVQEGVKLTIVLLDNHGSPASAGCPNRSAARGFGTEYRHRTERGLLDGESWRSILPPMPLRSART